MEAERLGKYELQKSLGRGGMGEVWQAYDTELRRYVAIKLLHANLQVNPNFVTHFIHEAQFVAALHHPNIVQIHDFQLVTLPSSSVKAYMVMDYVEGGTLADYIRSTARKSLFPPASEIVSLLTAISLAIDYAHQKGMIHRDIKPANILMDTSSRRVPGEPILTDFGIAKLQGTGTSTLTQAVIGTPLYISPEQAEGRELDERSDLYSLGIIVYEMLTGVTPFRGENPFTIMMQHVRDIPTPPALINPNIPLALSAVILQSISKDPNMRFPSAAAMTKAVAQTFNLPVPASLDTSRQLYEQLEYNPLQPQPSRLQPTSQPDVTYSTSPVTALSTTPSLPVSPSSLSQLPSLPTSASSTPPISSTSIPFRRRSLFIILIVCAVLLVGIGTFSAFLLAPSKSVTPTPQSGGTVVGRISFTSSSHASHNVYDQVDIELTNISAPAAGKTYYAWLESSATETAAYPHWELQVSNGSIQSMYTSNPSNTDLLAPSKLFLITEESVNSSPIIPIPDSARHRYYALITYQAASSPTFAVKQCPSSNASGSSNPCI